MTTQRFQEKQAAVFGLIVKQEFTYMYASHDHFLATPIIHFPEDGHWPLVRYSEPVVTTVE